MKPIEASDVGVMMAFAQKVIIVPGYGMAVAQAQHKIWELCQLLIDRGVTVKFAIHPVAGRMPGHMNVLLAEAGVPYDLIADLDEINAEFETADVALIIGANDVVNPVARTDKSSPIYGMPILNADKAKNVIVIKRGKGAGFSGIENALFYLDNTRMLYGDAQKAARGADPGGEGGWLRRRGLYLNGAVRGAIIAYGIAAYSYFVAQPESPAALPAFLLGIAIQVAVLAARVLAKRYEGDLPTTALPTIELIADGITVLLFALATYQGILQRTASF